MPRGKPELWRSKRGEALMSGTSPKGVVWLIDVPPGKRHIPARLYRPRPAKDPIKTEIPSALVQGNG
ncbi:MAG: hypothetical protein CMM62_00840 [Rhodospirillaceae bacterium]|nr:hypothetical protein [Rhodospirillaceae bacterium]MAX61894.1 hypothetical protein [Rhodospirillaceae bacterium]|tara:strand:+ start:424 stop:624 length:201 start_codon:yes stop_codon:yes gene_type:complete